MASAFYDMIKSWQRQYKPDRVVLVKTLFKSIFHQTDYLARGKQALWVGVCRTTRPYYKKLQSHGASVSTIDIDPAMARFGHGRQHVIGDACDLGTHYEADFFDIVFCNGVMGWGINTEAEQAQCFAAMGTVMKPGGLLVLGWNTHKSRDPLVTKLHDSHFLPMDLPGFGQRMVVQGATYVFDMFTRR